MKTNTTISHLFIPILLANHAQKFKRFLLHIIGLFFLSTFIIYPNVLFAQTQNTSSLPNILFTDNDEDDNEAIPDNQDLQAKLLHLDLFTNIENFNEQTFYVGQYITIVYRLILHNDAKIVYTEFNPSLEQQKKQKKAITTKLITQTDWELYENEYRAEYTFKILTPNAIIPSLVVHVQNNYLQDSMQTQPIALQAQNLKSNPNYSGVVADNLKIIDYTLENYDDKANMILIELEGIKSNLEDFKLPNIKDQEFGQGTKFGYETARANVLAKIPHNTALIKFNYFDLSKHDFVTLEIPNTINLTTFEEDIKEDLNPKSSFLRLTNIILLVLLGWFLLMTLIRRSYFWVILSCLLFSILVYRIFSNTYSITTLPHAKILIQPTQNSTILFTIPNPTKLEAIDKKNNYYKVHIDSKVGWISRNDTNKAQH